MSNGNMCAIISGSELSKRKAEDRSIILISRGVGSVVSYSGFCPGPTDSLDSHLPREEIEESQGDMF